MTTASYSLTVFLHFLLFYSNVHYQSFTDMEDMDNVSVSILTASLEDEDAEASSEFRNPSVNSEGEGENAVTLEMREHQNSDLVHNSAGWFDLLAIVLRSLLWIVDIITDAVVAKNDYAEHG